MTSPGPITLMPDLSSPRSAYCFMKFAALPRRDEHEHGIGLGILHPLQERRENRELGERHFDFFDDLTAAGGEMLLEEIQRVIAGRVVRGERRDLLDAVSWRAQSPMMVAGLRQREGWCATM